MTLTEFLEAQIAREKRMMAEAKRAIIDQAEDSGEHAEMPDDCFEP